MKIKNTTLANLSVGAVSTRGKASKKYMVVPGEATLELDDNLWLTEYAGPTAKMVKAGNLEITVEPAKSDEQVAKEAEANLKAARKLVDAADGKGAPEVKPAPTALQNLASNKSGE